jgi:hypothetical protein
MDNNFSLFFNLAFGIMLLIYGTYSLTIGLRGIIKKKPFLIPERQITWVFTIGCLPLLFNLIWTLLSYRRGNPIDEIWYGYYLLGSLLFIPAILLLWRKLSGYTVVGITYNSFRNALISVLARLNLPFKETIFKIHLVETNADLWPTIPSLGIANLRITPKKHQPLLDQIAGGLRDYFVSPEVRINRISNILFTLLSVLAFGLAIELFIMGKLLYDLQR